MSSSVRVLVTLAAILSVAVCAIVIDGCVSKPPTPEKQAPQAQTTQAIAKQPQPDLAVAPTAPPQPEPPTQGTANQSASDAIPAPARTSDERRAMIDRRLTDSLGAFDAKLRSEQQKIAKERDARQTNVVTVAAVDSNDSHGGGLNRNRSNGNRDSGDLKSEKGRGMEAAANAGNGAVANEVPDGNDDDVVARRLRKAAEQETDPELKDKLWKEYVEYKKNAQGK